MLNRIKLGFTLGMLLGATGLSMSTHAADIEDGVVKRITSMDRPTAGLGHIEVKNIDLSAKIKRDATGTPLAPAQGVSFYEVYAVSSANYGTEYFAPNWYIRLTTGDHGGAYLYVYTLQYGYGNPNAASLDATTKSYAYSRALCGSFSALHDCSVGESITGWLYGWDFTGKQYGYFQTSTNSIAYPYGYWSDTMSIK